MTAVESNDIYAGYHDYSSAYATSEMDPDEYFRENLRSSYGSRVIVSFNCLKKKLIWIFWMKDIIIYRSVMMVVKY